MRAARKAFPQAERTLNLKATHHPWNPTSRDPRISKPTQLKDATDPTPSKPGASLSADCGPSTGDTPRPHVPVPFCTRDDSDNDGMCLTSKLLHTKVAILQALSLAEIL